MTKKRLRYSELGAPAVQAPPVASPAVQPATPRPKRVSTPVELARALAAAQALEAGSAAEEAAPSASPSPRRAPGQGREREELVDLLMFRVGQERFAVELLAVEEVIELPVIHHVPEMPPAMLGVVMVRGSLTPVYSPHQALGLPLALGEAVLIFRRGGAGTRVGVLIDDVEDAVSLDLLELRRAPGAEDNDEVVLGVLRHASALVAIVDADALIAACQLAALQETA